MTPAPRASRLALALLLLAACGDGAIVTPSLPGAGDLPAADAGGDAAPGDAADGAPEVAVPDADAGSGPPDAVSDTGTPDGGADTGAPDDDATPPPPAPLPGEIVVVELMPNPVLIPDAAGEWIELLSLADHAVDLAGCTLGDAGTDAHTFPAGAGALVPAGATWLLARSADPATDGSVVPDAVYTGVTLANGGDDEVILTCAGEVVDAVAWTAGAWPFGEGVAAAFGPPGPPSAAANDDPAAWCPATSAYAAGNLGTPGAPNPPCPVPDTAVDDCRVTFPVDDVAVSGASVTLTAVVFDEGDTDATPGLDPVEGLAVEAGWAPADAPGLDDLDAWTWAPAAGVAGWDDAAFAPGWDGYAATLPAPAPGAWRVAFRASRDGGATWLACDLTGAGDGFAPADAGALTTGPDPCEGGDACAVPPPAACDGDVLLTPVGPGTCVADGLAAACSYAEAATDCAATGGTCAEGACVGAAVAPAPGGVIFTEIMQNPAATPDSSGEWLEVTNVSGAPVDLAGCELSGGATENHVLDAGGPLLLAGGAAAVLARAADPAANGGVAPLYVYAGVVLGNGADLVRLTCGGVEIDTVAWDGGATFPDPDGAAMQLDPSAYDAAANDLGASWCPAPAAWAGADLGSPGAVNAPCPAPDPCAGVTCDAPPAPDCDGDLARTYEDPGACETGACAYPVASVVDCALEGLACVDGACVAPPDPCAPNPCLAPPPATCQGDVLLVPAQVGACEPEGDGFACAYPPAPFDCAAFGGSCADGPCADGACAEAACAGVGAAPAPGQVLFTELLVDPERVGDGEGEWLELTNTSDAVVDLAGCVLRDQQDDDFALPDEPPRLLAPGARLLLAASPTPAANGGLVPDVSYAGQLSLANDVPDELVLECGGAVIDAVAWDPTTWPLVPGAALQLAAGAYDAAANDLPESWCAAYLPFGLGDLGSPGAPDPPCPTPTPVDRCRLQGPATLTVLKGDPAAFEGRVLVAGVTDATDGVDPFPLVRGQLGRGPVGSDPAASPEAWTFVDAAPLAGWSAAEAGDPGLDAYLGAFPAAPAGTFAVAFRFTADGGLTWTACDRDAGVPGQDGSEDGYQPANAATLVVNPSACVPNPCDDPPPPACDGDVLAAFAPVGACTLVGGAASCAYAPAPVDCAALAGTCAGGACQGVAVPPLPGEVVLTELMPDPAAVSDGKGEWIELTSAADHALVLDGCRLQDVVGGDDHALAPAAPLLLFPGEAVVLAASADPAANGGVDAAYAYGGKLVLNNTADAVVLRCGDAVVDAVAYDATWPFASGAAMQLAPGAGADGNDAADAWCAAWLPYGAGDRGTPGAPNPPCPVPDPVDWCRLQWPLDLAGTSGDEVDVYVRLYEAGVTDQGPGVDPDPLLAVQIGWGPDGSDPTAGLAGWSLAPAQPNPGWTDAAEPGNDEYVATWTLPAPGTYDFAARVTADGGLTWTWCDRAAGPGKDGVEDGYQVASAGAATVAAGPCDPNPCTAPPPAGCDGDVATGFADPGACTPDGAGGHTCTWPPVEVDCAALGGTCAAGACVGLPPAPAPGEVIFTEIMRNPKQLLDTAGEWLEVRNVSGGPVDLGGCRLESGGDAGFTLPAAPALVLAPGAYAVLARADDPAAVGPAAVYTGVTLGNGADSVALACEGLEVDAVAWDAGETFPAPDGASMQLDPAASTAAANDDGAAWCASTEPWAGGDLGSPGSDNAPCAGPALAVAWCRLQGPLEIEGIAGTPVEVAGRVEVPGVTDATAGPDPHPLLRGQLAWAPDGALDPSADPTGWQALEAAPDAAPADPPEPGRDAYAATWPLPAEGLYLFAFRFSADGGASWTWCDGGAGDPALDGSADGFALADAGLALTSADPCAGAPCDDPPAGTCAGDVAQGYEPAGTCSPGPPPLFEADCAYAPAPPLDCAAAGKACSGGACVPLPAPAAPGDVVISEIMRNPSAPVDLAAEWLELHNPGAQAWDLAGCELRGATAVEHVLAPGGPLVLPAGGQVVLAASGDPALNGGVAPDYVYAGVNLSNGDDLVELRCGGTTIDAVAWDATFPAGEGASMTLDPLLLDADLNDDGAAWCEASTAWAGGDRGTPGAPNDPCPSPNPVDRCRLQAPLAVTALEGDALAVRGRFREAGLTGLGPGDAPDPWVRAQAGVGPAGSDPATSPGWAWADAAPDPAWDDAEEPGAAQWEAVLTLPAPPALPASLDLAFRVTVDAGLTWTACDRDAGPGSDGSEDGYQPALAGKVTLLDSPCLPNPCSVPPDPSCEGTALSVPGDPGVCTVDGTAAACSWPASLFDCASVGAACEAGACVGGPPWPAPGEVAFTEIMQNPAAVDDALGEWAELTLLGDAPVDLAGCVVTSANDAGHLLVSPLPLVLQPGDAFVLARSGDLAANGGVEADYVAASGLVLGNGSDTLGLLCGMTVVDLVAWDDGATFPDPTGASMALGAQGYGGDNGAGAAWCEGATPYGAGDLGTPGAPNPPCP